MMFLSLFNRNTCRTSVLYVGISLGEESRELSDFKAQLLGLAGPPLSLVLEVSVYRLYSRICSLNVQHGGALQNAL